MGQVLFDRFCQDMDHNLREMGIGDLSVPKEMQRMGEAFYGRTQAYRAALAAQGEKPLIEVVARNVYGGVPPASAAPARLAAYMREAGKLRLPDPDSAVLVEDKGELTED